jgi:RNA polymerase sigma factor (sigma-70 family)
VKRCGIDAFWASKYDELRRCAEKSVGTLADDLLHDLAVWTYEHEKAGHLCERNELAYYLVSVIKMCGHSQTTPFHKKYRKFTYIELPASLTETSEDNTRAEQQLEWIAESLKSVKYFDARIFEMYYQENKSLTSLANDTGIPRSTIYKSIAKTKAHLQAQAKDGTGRYGGEHP